MDNETQDLKNKNKPKREKVKKVKTPRRVKKAKFTGEKSSRKNLILIGGSVLLVVILSATIFATLTSLFSTENYYVLNSNVKAKQEITPDMVVARETAAGTAPVNAIDMETIQRGGVYSRYPLYAGDVISYSNVGPLSGESLGIPDDWGVTSFSIDSTDAVGGILGKGDYIDIVGINTEGAQYIFNNVLILETKFVNEEIDGNVDGQTVVGEIMHYTVGMPAEDIAYLHSALFNYSQGEDSGVIRIVKAPYELNYAERNVSELDEPFKYGPEIGNIDLIEGTDPTFTDIERDETGRPIKKEEIEDGPEEIVDGPANFADDEDFVDGPANFVEDYQDDEELEDFQDNEESQDWD